MTSWFERLSTGWTRRILVAAAVLGIGAWLAVSHGWLGGGNELRRFDAPSESAGAPDELTLTPTQWSSLTIEPVRRKLFDAVATSDGTVMVDENRSVAIFSQFSGRVIDVRAQAGQLVHKGSALASILAVEAAQSRSDTASAMAAEATALKLLELARLTEQRQHQLFLAEAGAEKDWQQSRTDLVAAENAHHAAQAGLGAAHEKSAILGDPITSRSGGAGQTVIVAPIDGMVVQRQIAAGQYVNSLAGGGSAPLFTITNGRTVWVVANLSESQATRVTIGQRMDASSFALPGRTWHGKVSWIAPSVDATSHRIAVRAEIDNADGTLKPQMSLTVRLLQAQASESIAVPRSAVVFDGSDAHCFVVSGEKTLRARPLKLGRVDADTAEVLAGLELGDRVVTKGALFVDSAAEDANS